MIPDGQADHLLPKVIFLRNFSASVIYKTMASLMWDYVKTRRAGAVAYKVIYYVVCR